jgi:hypothetical protein
MSTTLGAVTDRARQARRALAALMVEADRRHQGAVTPALYRYLGGVATRLAAKVDQEGQR